MDIEKIKALKAKLVNTDTPLQAEAGGEPPAQLEPDENEVYELTYIKANSMEDLDNTLNFSYLNNSVINGKIEKIQRVKDKDNYSEPKNFEFGCLSVKLDKNKIAFEAIKKFDIYDLEKALHYFYESKLKKWIDECGVYISGTDSLITYILICSILSQRPIFPLLGDRNLLENAISKINIDYNKGEEYIHSLYGVNEKNILLRRKKLYMIAFENAHKNGKTLNIKKELV